MSVVYPWQRAFWSDAHDGFRAGWLIGWNVGLCVMCAAWVVSLSVHENFGALTTTIALVAIGWLAHDWYATAHRNDATTTESEVNIPDSGAREGESDG